jgi:hypothetical protein
LSTSFAKHFLQDGLGAPAGDQRGPLLVRALERGESGVLEEAIADALAGMYADIPYNLHIPVEAWYHGTFLAFMQAIGLRVEGESAVAGGEVDGTLDLVTGHSYVIEVKYAKPDEANLEALAATALAQIQAKGYADRYRGTGRTVHWVGLAVSGKGNVKVALRD